MEENICKEYLETNAGIENLAYKYHLSKLKIKSILLANGIEIKKRGNQKSKEKFIVEDWRIEKYKPIDGMEYIVFDPKSNFKSKDIRNDGGKLTNYLKKAYLLEIPTLYDRRMYYMKTGNYWWEQWLSVKLVSCGSIKIIEEDWSFIEATKDSISEHVSNRIRDAVTRPTKRVAKIKKTKENGIKKTKNEIFIEKALKAHPNENLDYSKVEYKDKSTPVYIIDHDLRPDGTEYGGYWQRPENHLRGSGHPYKFRDRQHMNDENWDLLVERFKKSHNGENLEYIRPLNYRNLHDKICYIDHDLRPDGTEYGEIWQVAYEHLKGRKHPAKYHDSRKGWVPYNKKNRRAIQDGLS